MTHAEAIDESVDGQIIEHEGYWIDTSTGEIVGLVEEKPAFRVTDRESAEWVLEKMDAAECEASGLETRLAAIQERMQTMIREKRKRVEWLRMRFGAELEQFAREQLVGAKTKTLKTPWGNLALRTVPGRLALREGVETRYTQMLDSEDEARNLPLLQWAIDNRPECVKATLEFQVSKLPKDAELPDQFFEQTEPVEKFDIKVGAR